jgi:hypothetical protein
LFNRAAFEPTGALATGYYYGQGPRISNDRNFGYHNHDFGLTKTIDFTERVKLEFKSEFFNIWNWHTYNVYGGLIWGGLAFDNNVSSATFGQWNGNVTPPRNIQFGMKVTF